MAFQKRVSGDRNEQRNRDWSFKDEKIQPCPDTLTALQTWDWLSFGMYLRNGGAMMATLLVSTSP